MKYALDKTTVFKRDYKRAVKRGLPVEKLKAIVAKLAKGKGIPHAQVMKESAVHDKHTNIKHSSCVVNIQCRGTRSGSLIYAAGFRAGF